MTNVPRAVLIIALVATTGLTTVLGLTDPAAPVFYPTRFLIWNLFLAWIPVFFAAGFAAVHRRVWLLPFSLGWLAFLPNSPYLVTDLVHLGEGVELWQGSDSGYWRWRAASMTRRSRGRVVTAHDECSEEMPASLSGLTRA